MNYSLLARSFINVSFSWETNSKYTSVKCETNDKYTCIYNLYTLRWWSTKMCCFGCWGKLLMSARILFWEAPTLATGTESPFTTFTLFAFAPATHQVTFQIWKKKEPRFASRVFCLDKSSRWKNLGAT